MKTQNFANHTRNDRGRTYIALVVLIITIIAWSALIPDIIQGIKQPWFHRTNVLTYLIPTLVLIAVWIGVLKLRMYAKILQDRIIRQEVNFRYYVATGKTLPESLTVSQIVALRFAGDDEFLALVDRVIKNPSLTNKEIKKMIKNRRWDYHRV